jgi:hypothetical protein
MCRCVVGVQTFQRKVVPPSSELYTIILELLNTEDQGTRVFETSTTTYPTTRHHISE